MATEKLLTVLAINDYSVGPYNYYVSTPNDGCMYFHTKKQATNFINFYKEYQTKQQDKNGNKQHKQHLQHIQ